MATTKQGYMRGYVPSNAPRTKKEKQELTNRVSKWIANYSLGELDPNVPTTLRGKMQPFRHEKVSKQSIKAKWHNQENVGLISPTPTSTCRPSQASFLRRPTMGDCPPLSEANSDEDERSISTRRSRFSQSLYPVAAYDDFDEDTPQDDNWLDDLYEDELQQPSFLANCSTTSRRESLGSEVSRHDDLSWCGDINKVYRMPITSKQLDVASTWFRERCPYMGRMENDGEAQGPHAIDLGVYRKPKRILKRDALLVREFEERELEERELEEREFEEREETSSMDLPSDTRPRMADLFGFN